jgi:transcriptional regulator with XRE-family HTH domain
MLNDRLKNLRLAKGLTLQQVGDVFDISRSSVSSWESGKNQPDPRKLEKLATLFGTTVHFIVTGQNQGLTEHISPDLTNRFVPFVSWSSLATTQEPTKPITLVQCLYFTPSKSAFATRYLSSDSVDWQPSLIPAGAIIVIDPTEEPIAGKLVLVSRDDDSVEIAQTYKLKTKSELGLQFVNSKLTENLSKAIKVIGVIQEWRIVGKF